MKTNDFRETKVNNYSRSNALSISETMKRSNDLLFSFFFQKGEILLQISIGYKRLLNPRYDGVNFPLFTDVYFA